MATSKAFRVEYQFVKNAATPARGDGGAAQIRKELHIATVIAASNHPGDLLSVLSSNITVPGGFSIEIVASKPIEGPGTEGSVIYS